VKVYDPVAGRDRGQGIPENMGSLRPDEVRGDDDTGPFLHREPVRSHVLLQSHDTARGVGYRTGM
jgi:hypothetical protein